MVDTRMWESLLKSHHQYRTSLQKIPFPMSMYKYTVNKKVNFDVNVPIHGQQHRFPYHCIFSDINECTIPTSLPCQHGGTCVDHVNRYTCVCVAGYNGVHCETGNTLFHFLILLKSFSKYHFSFGFIFQNTHTCLNK